MDDKMREKLEKFGEEMEWLGMEIEDLESITSWTLGKLEEYLEELSAPSEASVIREAMELVSTHLT